MYVVAYNNNMKQIIYYKTKSGKCPYLDWYNNLDNNIKNRIRARLERVEENNFGDYKKIDSNLSELRQHKIKISKKAKEYILDFEERYKND